MPLEIKTADELLELIRTQVNNLVMVKDRHGEIRIPRLYRTKPTATSCNWNVQEYLHSEALNEAICHIVESLRRRYKLPALWSTHAYGVATIRAGWNFPLKEQSAPL